FAHHYWEADLQSEAAPHLWKAAQVSASAYELVQAERSFDRLATVMAKDPAVLADPEERARMAESYGYVLFDRGRFDTAETWFETLEELGQRLSRPEWVVRSLWYRGLNAVNRGQPDRAETLLERGLSLLAAPDDRLEADLHSGLGLVHHDRRDAERSLEHHEQALTLRRKIGDDLGTAKSLMNMGNVYFNLRADHGKAEEHYEEALAFSQKAGDRLMRSGCTLNLGSLSLDRGEWPRALRRFQRVHTLAEEMGWSFLRFLSLRCQAECHLRLGQIDRALSILETCRSGGDDVLIPFNRVAIRLLQFEAYTCALADERAREALDSARETAERLGVTEAGDWLRLCEGRRLALEGDLEEAAQAFADAGRLAAELQNRDLERIALAHRVRAILRAGMDGPDIPVGEPGDTGPTAALSAYLLADGRPARNASGQAARELAAAGDMASRLGCLALERAAFERQADVLAELRASGSEMALERAARAMHKLAGHLPAELREAFLEHPRNATLRAVVLETADTPGAPALRDT
ncbi:MAG TPA: tetratricopeptide repeat protein, partial [Solirubrobacterales bacterium]|nr:tetratricopeptide repeat protein [Solirubrobacterales bacterium]